MGKDYLLAPDKREIFQKRQKRWKHTSFLGSVRMADLALRQISGSETATQESKALALELLPKVKRLYLLLQTRREGT